MNKKITYILVAMLAMVSMVCAAEVVIQGDDVVDLIGYDFSTARKIKIRLCPYLVSLEGLDAPNATHIKISKCQNLESLANFNAPNATHIKISRCHKLVSFKGFDAPKAIAIVVSHWGLQREADEIVARNRWSDLRAIWVNLTARKAKQRLHQASLTAADAVAPARRSARLAAKRLLAEGLFCSIKLKES